MKFLIALLAAIAMVVSMIVGTTLVGVRIVASMAERDRISQDATFIEQPLTWLAIDEFTAESTREMGADRITTDAVANEEE